MPSKSKKLWLAPLFAAGLGLVVVSALNPGNKAKTEANHADSRLRTRRYGASMEEVQKAVVEAVQSLRTYGKVWRIVAERENEIQVEVPVLVFTDDLVITLQKAPDGVLLDVQSSARMGKSDWGENRRHVLQLLAALDEKLAS
jgi:uncharacterized protein (DUF1499 family)